MSSVFRAVWGLRTASLKTVLPEAHLAKSPGMGNLIITGQDGKGAARQGSGGRGHLCPQHLLYVYMFLTMKWVRGNIFFICGCITEECVYVCVCVRERNAKIPRKTA